MELKMEMALDLRWNRRENSFNMLHITLIQNSKSKISIKPLNGIFKKS